MIEIMEMIIIMRVIGKMIVIAEMNQLYLTAVLLALGLDYSVYVYVYMRS
jgi:hypothetical protein